MIGGFSSPVCPHPSDFRYAYILVSSDFREDKGLEI